MTESFLYDPDNRPEEFFDENNRPWVRFSFRDAKKSFSVIQPEKDRQINPFLFNQAEVKNLKRFIDEVIKEIGPDIAVEEGSLSNIFLRSIIKKNTEGEARSVAVFTRVKKFNLEKIADFLVVYPLLNQMYQQTT